MDKAREEIAKQVYEGMEWACLNNCGDKAPAWVECSNSFAQQEARKQADAILAAPPEVMRKNPYIIADMVEPLMAEHDTLQAKLQDQALSHLSALGQLTGQINSPAHAAKVLLALIFDEYCGGRPRESCKADNISAEWAWGRVRAIAEQEQDT